MPGAFRELRRAAMTTFVDRVTLYVAGGRGGNGCASIHREKFKPFGGPVPRVATWSCRFPTERS
jgi:hypothetical protein